MTKTIKVATMVFTSLLLTVLLLLSIRGLVDPHSAAASFGVAIADPSADLYQFVYRSRNLILAVTGIVFLLSGMWRAIAILITASIFLPVFDIVALRIAHAPVTPVHSITLVALTIAAILAWVRVRLETTGTEDNLYRN